MTKALEKHLAAAQHGFHLPPGAREIILLRHGSTVGETVHTLPFGDIILNNPPLRPDGHAQAHAVAARLRHEPITHIFVTNLQRTHQTAAPLAALTGLTPIEIPELHELHMGEWEHDFMEKAAAGHPLVKQMLAEETWEVIPDTEPTPAFTARIRAGIAKITAIMAENTTAVAVVHGGVIGKICQQATGSRPFAFFAPDNASISRLIVNADGHWSLRSYNDTAHMSARW